MNKRGPLLEVKNLTVSYGHVEAVREGTTHAVITYGNYRTVGLELSSDVWQIVGVTKHLYAIDAAPDESTV